MKKQRLDTYERMPNAMSEYLSTYGWHFSKSLVDYATGRMIDRSGNRLQAFDKDKTEKLLVAHSVQVDNIYDAVYVINMAVADYMGSSILTEQQLAKFVGDYLNDKDGYDGIALTRYYADTIGKGEPIYWEDML